VREHYVEIVKPDLREWRDAVGAGIVDKNIERRAAFQCRNGRDIGEVEANVSALPASRRMASRSASSSRERARSFTCAPACASADPDATCTGHQGAFAAEIERRRIWERDCGSSVSAPAQWTGFRDRRQSSGLSIRGTAPVFGSPVNSRSHWRTPSTRRSSPS
jgi:hypothetical protein